jgi:Predicted integral membrane protein
MFKLESPLVNFLNKVADIMILGIVFMIACVPVITGGAALTAAYYMGFKMVKNEETYIIKGFFKAFKENFKQATILWIFVLIIMAVIVADYRIILYSGIAFASGLRIAMVSVTLIAALGIVFVFPLQARFQNTVKHTFKNAFLMALSHLPSAFLLIIIYAVPYLILWLVPRLFPVVFLLGFGGIFYFKSFVLLRVFRKYESAEETEKSVDDEGGLFAESERIENEIKEKKDTN